MGTATATAGAAASMKTKEKQKLQMRPKNYIHKSKTKDKRKKKFSNTKINEKKNEYETIAETTAGERAIDVIEGATVFQQLSFFIDQYQSANRVQLSSLELDSLKVETCILEQGSAQSFTGNLDDRVKVAFGSSWREVLCEKHFRGGKVDPGNPALLVISSSALRSLDLLRELRSLTKDCHAAKLFSKHMKIEEQVSILKNRVNIASGTPSRIKKLIDMEALRLSRLAVIVLDMHTDVKGYSLFTLPQVRDEFWDLYGSYFHQPLVEGKLRLCLYGPIPYNSEAKKRKPKDDQVVTSPDSRLNGI